MSERSISELVLLLQDARPDALSALKQRFPNEPLLSGGAVLGAAATRGDKVQRSLRVRGETAREALVAYMQVADQVLAKLGGRLRFGRRVEFAGQLVSALASASLFIRLGKTDQNWLIAAAAISLGGVLCAAVAKYLQGDPTSGRSLVASYDRLIQDRIGAPGLQTDLDVELAEDSLDKRRVDGLVQRADAMAERVNELRYRLGMASR